METLEELQKILDDAPRENMGENLFYNIRGAYILFSEDNFYERYNNKWVKCGDFIDMYGARSIDDIQYIVDLMTLNQNMHTTVTGYLYGKEWAHWNEFNAGKFKL